MHQHRFRHHLESVPVSIVADGRPVTGAFVVCPMALLPGGMEQRSAWMAIYQRAYECAQAVVRPSRLERLEAVSWN